MRTWVARVKLYVGFVFIKSSQAFGLPLSYILPILGNF